MHFIVIGRTKTVHKMLSCLADSHHHIMNWDHQGSVSVVDDD